MEPINLVDVKLKTHVHDQPNVTEEQAFASVCEKPGNLKNLFEGLVSLIEHPGVGIQQGYL